MGSAGSSTPPKAAPIVRIAAGDDGCAFREAVTIGQRASGELDELPLDCARQGITTGNANLECDPGRARLHSQEGA